MRQAWDHRRGGEGGETAVRVVGQFEASGTSGREWGSGQARWAGGRSFSDLRTKKPPTARSDPVPVPRVPAPNWPTTAVRRLPRPFSARRISGRLTPARQPRIKPASPRRQTLESPPPLRLRTFGGLW